jgi:acetyl esterase/lipase
MLLGLARSIYGWFRFSIDALFARNIPFRLRCLMLLSQPVTLLTYSISAFPWILRRPFTVEWLPIAPGRLVRALVFKHSAQTTETAEHKLRPLHVDFHGGAFLGGLPEADAHWCDRLARETGAVVISASYRYAPTHTFPAAHDDADAVIAYLLAHAEERFGADPSLLTTSGFSAGGTLAVAAAQTFPGRIAAAALFQPVMDLRLTVREKPRPAGFPSRDPLSFMYPLFDSYGAPARAIASNSQNARMAPILAPLAAIPENVMLVVGGIDILAKEELSFAEHVKQEIASDPKQAGRKVEVIFEEKGFHGYLERAFQSLRTF